ncbi:MAG: biotin--[acetyl-CoA-carboxylase] ligase [Bacteroidota bacterium]
MDSFNKVEIGIVAERLPRVDSTNLELIRRLQSGGDMPEGYVLTAHNQTHGRGQAGTDWHTQSGANWTGSIYLKPTHLAADAGFRLSQVVALAVVRVCMRVLGRGLPAEVYPPLTPPTGEDRPPSNSRERSLTSAQLLLPGEDSTPIMKEESQPLPLGGTGGGITIKWPNDILIEDRKVAGVLIQTGLQGQQLAWAVIGIGLNVNQTEFQVGLSRPACSLASVAGRKFDLDVVQAELLAGLQKEYARTQLHLADELDADYQSWLYRRGELATYRERGQSRTFVGILRGTDPQGRLLLDSPDGRMRTYDPKSIEFI